MDETLSRSSSRRSSRRRGSSVASTSSLNSEWETREQFNYVEETSISEWLKCPICISPFVKPVVSPSCSHTFCHSCIKHALTPEEADQPGAVEASTQSTRMRSRMPMGTRTPLEEEIQESLSPYSSEDSISSSLCPSCRTPVTLFDFQPAQPIIRHMVDALIVKCPHHKRGCNDTAQRQFLKSHLVRDCQYTYVGEYPEDSASPSQINSDLEFKENGRKNRKGKGRCECGAKVMKKDFEDHKKAACSAKWRECDACKESVRETDFSSHIETCPRWPVECSHCRKVEIRSQLSPHEDSCPRKIVNCPHEKWGCGWRGELESLRRTSSSSSNSSPSHQESNLHLSSCRFEALSPLLSTLSRKFSEVRAENSILRARMNRMEEERQDLLSSIEACRNSLGSFLISSDEVPESTSHDRFNGIRERARGGVFSGTTPNLVRSHSSPLTSTSISTSAPTSTSSHFPPRFSRSESFDRDGVTLHGALEDPWSRFSTSSTSHHPVSPIRDPENPTSRRSSTSQSSRRNNQAKDLVSTINLIQSSIDSLNSAQMNLERRNHEDHLAALSTGFEVGRAHEEVASLRHGLHAVRMQMHSLLMQQQQRSPAPGIFGSAPPPNQNGISTSTSPTTNGGVLGRRVWGFDQTKL